MLSGRKILLGVTGGIAAYKAADLLRFYQKAGAEVRVTMTPSATRFVGVETFAALSRQEVAVSMWGEETDPDNWVRHVHWTEWADIFVIAPCTANTLAKICSGLTDNMLTTMVSAARCPLLLCPTMDGEMYQSPAVQRNLEQARSDGIEILEPEEGYLASGLSAPGRLPEPETIHSRTEELLSRSEALSGRKVLVTAGPTREFVDAVRFISNPSSGKMGIALARAARSAGADVTLLAGPITEPLPYGVSVQHFTSAEELFGLVKEALDETDILIMSAAVSDFRPKSRTSRKVKKEDAETFIETERTPDILEWVGANRRSDQTIIGFAMETDEPEKHARKKLEQKNLDWIAANKLVEGQSGFSIDRNDILLIGADGTTHRFDGEKQAIARQLLEAVFTE